MLAELRGVNFRGAEARDTVLGVSIGDPVSLSREPSNQYDENAVKVLINNVFVGYVGKEWAAKLAPRMDDGESFTALIEDYNTPLSPILRIEPDEVEAA